MQSAKEPVRFPANLGRPAMRFVDEAGSMLLFFLSSVRHIVAPRQIPKIITQVYVIGAQSFFLIALIGVFTGMVLGLQGYYTLVQFGSEGMLGAAVALTLIRELGPVLTALMIAGRAGSAMTAEIGVMRITDQIDALDVMDINPISYLVSPRLVASIIAFPILTAVFDVIGILGGYLTGVVMLGINSGVYFYRIEHSTTMTDVSGGFAKAVAFAVLVTLACCYKGYMAHTRTDGAGPVAVGNATTSAVVLSCVFVLMADYVLTSVLL